MVRLVDGKFSNGLEALTALSRVSAFDEDLGIAIRGGGAERAVYAMRCELLPESLLVTSGGAGAPYRSAPNGTAPLPPGHFRVQCRYVLPPWAELKGKGKMYDDVSTLFNGGSTWKRDRSCLRIDERPGERIILAKDFGAEWEDEEALDWCENYRSEFAPNGYRPTIETETIDFGINPETRDLQRQCWLLGLGSFALGVDDHRYVAVLHGASGSRFLGYRWSGHRRLAHSRALLVRK